jgi:outer membrane protein
MKGIKLSILAWMLLPAALLGQQVKVAVVDMERAIVQSAEGKKAEAGFTTKFEELRKSIDGKQKELESAQTKLRTQERLLDDTVKGDLNRTVTRLQTEIARQQEDAQKELDDLRNELMRPIAQVAETVLKNYAAEAGFTLIIDSSNPNGSIVFVNDDVDITNEMIKRIDAEMAKNPPKKP